MAMSEAQPGMDREASPVLQAVLIESFKLVMQALDKPTIESLRSMQHRDVYGNLISTLVEARQEAC